MWIRCCGQDIAHVPKNYSTRIKLISIWYIFNLFCMHLCFQIRVFLQNTVELAYYELKYNKISDIAKFDCIPGKFLNKSFQNSKVITNLDILCAELFSLRVIFAILQWQTVSTCLEFVLTLLCLQINICPMTTGAKGRK